MRINATNGSVKVELTAKEKRDLRAGRDVVSLLAEHTGDDIAPQLVEAMDIILDRFASETVLTTSKD